MLTKILLVVFLCSLAVRGDESSVQTFQLKDRINFPTYSWPRTLLHYPVEFGGKGVSSGNLRLLDAEDHSVPFQLSELKTKGNMLTGATVSFFSDLPSGGERIFRLVQQSNTPVATVEHSITSSVTPAGIEVTGGRVAVRLPASQLFASKDNVPGPILALNRGQGWIGQSYLLSPHRRVLSVKTEPVVTGDLYQVWRIRYAFEGGASYIATITVTSDYDFIAFDEAMNGLTEEDAVANEMDWIGFAPTRRFGADSWTFSQPGEKWPAIDRNIKTGYIQEDPRWDPGVIEDVSKEMWMKLSPSSGNQNRELASSCTFWDDRADGAELGVFVLDIKHWQDHHYGIWQPTSALMVTFRYRDGLLTWHWPLVTGTRATAINLNTVAVGEAAVEAMRRTVLKAVPKPSTRVNWSADTRFRYNRLLQQAYGPLSLDKVKDWVLTYPVDGRRPTNTFTNGAIRSTDELISKLFSSCFSFYMLGQGDDPGVDSIWHRYVYDWAVDGLVRLGGQMTSAQRERMDALLLLAGYVLVGEEMHPVRICLDGTPNMAADGWVQPMLISFLYPDHPMAREWRDYYAKQWQLNSLFYTRPDVPLWDAKGGRWTESLSIYNWAQLLPTAAAHTAGFFSDNINRWANHETALRGRWLVDMLTAPVNDPDPGWRQNYRNGPPKPPAPEAQSLRAYPAHGAHGSGSTVVVPPVVNELGYFLRNYDPLTAEHLLWVQSDSEPTEYKADKAPWHTLLRDRYAGNRGTPPDLRSCKYTGHGVVLRADVGSTNELSIHLQQVDRGPNYRWGWAGSGGCGSLYFYQNGKVWTGHEREDTGDHSMNDNDGVTGFSVMKNGAYRGIGQNVLDRPLMDLGVAQFTEITSRPGSDTWPEYDSRSIFLVGSDYFLIYDKIGVVGRPAVRFSWFVPKDCDFPEIIFLKPASARQDHYREVFTSTAKGFQRDANGSHLTFITAKRGSVALKDWQSQDLPFLSFAPLKQWRSRSSLPDGAYRAETPVSTDTFFRDEIFVDYTGKNEAFYGTAGVIRRMKNGGLQLAIASKGHIVADSLELRVETDDTGASLVRQGDSLSGIICSPDEGKVCLKFGSVPGTFYIDGVAAQTGSLILSRGRHHWEFTAGPAQPMRPAIERTENSTGGATVFFTPVSGATSYRVEVSMDNAVSWQTAASADAPPVRLANLENGRKVHLRLIALNGNRESEPSSVYPLYVSAVAPEPPDGLDLNLGTNRVQLIWGEVLGVTEYRLYRRECGSEHWKKIWHGLDRSYADTSAKGVIPNTELPGSLDNLPYTGTVYEYAVAAVNGSGEGAKSTVRNTDPTAWLNWLPKTPLRFKRQSEYVKPPYVPFGAVPPMYYPDAAAN
jgi:hypothetical protein